MNSQNDICMSLVVSSLLPLVCKYDYVFYHSEKLHIICYPSMQSLVWLFKYMYRYSNKVNIE